MDLLSRHLHYLSQKGTISGVRLSRGADPITKCVYADDLLILGATTIQEAMIIDGVLEQFLAISGQRVGHKKSMLWFSKATSNEEAEAISSCLRVPLDAKSDFYLDSPIKTNSDSYDFLVEKCAARLQAWKGQLLSQAGRVILIKSVLQALPVYYMATVKLPARVLKTLTGLIRRFMWGAMEKDRFISYVAWDRITLPMDMRGLALRYLSTINDVMLLKSLWKLAAGSQVPWVKLVIAKYLPRSDLWHTKKLYRCSNFWRSIMNLRPKLLPMITWQLGDGGLCNAYAEPWFPNAIEVVPQQFSMRRLKVRDLVSQDGNWEYEKILEMFGYQACVTIVSSIKPPKPNGTPDRLIFSLATNGVFSVKKAYTQLRESILVPQPGMLQHKALWSIVWKRGNISPRVRLFLWKILQRA